MALIDQDATIRALVQLHEETGVKTAQAIRVVREMPEVQPERKKGKWEIYVISMLDGEGCRCSECGFEGAPYWDYCPNCGSMMEEVESDNE